MISHISHCTMSGIFCGTCFVCFNEMTESESSRLLTKEYIKICGVVAAYWIISISIVFINKTLFSAKVFSLKAPLFVTWTQCTVAALICLSWEKCAKVFPGILSFPQSKPFQGRTIKTVLPVTILFVLTITFGNLSLSYVEVSFYLIARSLTTVLNVIFTFLILKQTTSNRVLLCCLVIIFGFLLGVDQENAIGTFSLSGTAFGVLSSVTLSLYSILTKKVLPSINNEVVLLTHYNNIYSIFLFIPLIIFNGELEELRTFDFTDIKFWFLTLISGIFGFLIGFITTLQIKVTSPLTHNISGTAKACAQTVIATYWYHETKSVFWWFSNFLVLSGSAVYARIRQIEMSQKQ